MLGPIALGSTLDLLQAWTLLHNLDQLANWGATEYSKWFQDEIIGSCKMAVGGGGNIEASAGR